MNKYIKSYKIDMTNNLKFARVNPSKSFNRGDLAEISLAEHYNDFNHDMHIRHKLSSQAPDLITSNASYQIKSLRASIEITTTVQDYVNNCACDLFALVLKDSETSYQVYELNKKQMLDMLLNDNLVYKDRASKLNGGGKTLRIKNSYKCYEEWFN